MPTVASLASNLTLPNGLQTTSHLSQEMMARDQRPVIPMGQSRQMMLNMSRPHKIFSPWGQYLGRRAGGLSWWRPGGLGPPSPGIPDQETVFQMERQSPGYLQNLILQCFQV